MKKLKITSADLLTYAKKKGITARDAIKIFDKHYTPTINGWFKIIEDK